MRILIVDDHPLFRAGLKALLFELDSKIETAEASTLKEVMAAQDRNDVFDLVLLDLHLPDGAGLEVLKQVKAAFEATPVVILSATDEARLICSAIDAGACGYIPKTTDPSVTVHALRLVLAHGIYLPASALQDGRRAEPVNEHESPRLSLSDRQIAVLQRMLQGKPNKIIARELGIAEGTVKAHLAGIYQVLNVSSRSQAMYRVHELGFFEQFAAMSRG